jgi:hypothetical protein
LQHSPPSPQQEAALVQVQLEKRARLAHAIIIEMIFMSLKKRKPARLDKKNPSREIGNSGVNRYEN